MIVINQGTNDQYFIFRGEDALAFAKQMDVFPPRSVIVALDRYRFERGQLFETAAGTYILAIDEEKLTDQQAREAFDKTLAAHVIDTWRKRGRRNA